MKQSSGWWFGTFFIFPFFPYIGNHIPNGLIVFMNPVMVTSRKMFHWNCPIFRISQDVSALATRLVGVFGHAHAFPQCAGTPVRKSSLWCGDGMGFSRPHVFDILCWVCCLKMWNINENPPFCFYGMVYPIFRTYLLEVRTWRSLFYTYFGWCVCLASTNRILDLSRFLIPYCLKTPILDLSRC